MGESNSVEMFATKIIAGGVAIGAANRPAVSNAALAAKKVTLAVATPDTGGDLRLPRWGRRGLRLNVGYEITSPSASTSRAVVRPRPIGPWAVLEDGADPHVIAPRPRGKRKALRVGDGFAARTNHPGSAGKKTWTKGVRSARPAATKAYQAVQHDALLKAFR